MSLAEVRQVIVEVIARATGLDEDHVFWANQDTNQPTLPFCDLKLSGLRSLSLDGRRYKFDATRPAGKEIEVSTFGYREATLSLELFAAGTVDAPDRAATALEYLERARAAFRLPGINDRLRAKHLSFFDLSAPIQSLPELVSVGFRGRAIWDVRMYLPATVAREFTGYIATVQLGMTVHGGSVDPETVTTNTPVPEVLVTPADATIAANASQTFVGSGGIGAPYSYALTNDSPVGSIDAVTGVYTAGDSAGTDTVQATDGAGNAGTASVTVTPSTPLSVTPANNTASGEGPGQNTQQYTAHGGVPPYHWDVTVPHTSGPSIDDTGLYTSGTGFGFDTIRLTDSASPPSSVTTSFDQFAPP